MSGNGGSDVRVLVITQWNTWDGLSTSCVCCQWSASDVMMTKCKPQEAGTCTIRLLGLSSTSVLCVISPTPAANMAEFAWVVGAPLFQVILTTGGSQASLLAPSSLGLVSGQLVILVCRSIGVEVAICNVDEFVSASKGEVPIWRTYFCAAALYCVMHP